MHQAAANVLVTGPSCAGKTTIARANAGVRCINLDRFASVAALPLAPPTSELTVYEGMLNGDPAAVIAFLTGMDAIVVVEAPLARRLIRAVRRDGLRDLGRFLRNEIGWRRFCAPLLADVRFAGKRVVATPAPTR